jgi:hypothetical protein
MPVAALRGPDGGPPKQVHDASAARTTMDGFQSAVARAATVPAAPAPAPAPAAAPTAPRSENDAQLALTRRTPGANLAPGLRAPGVPARRAPEPAVRDPEAARAALDAFTAGFARAIPPNPDDLPEHPGDTKESNP